MKKLLALLGFLWIAASAICQTDYPKLELINGDTLVLFKPVQVTKMNKTFLQLDSTVAINKSLREEIQLLNKKELIITGQYKTCEEKSIILTNISNEKQQQVEILTNENKKQAKKIKVLKKIRNLYGIGGIVVGTIGTYLLTQKVTITI